MDGINGFANLFTTCEKYLGTNDAERGLMIWLKRLFPQIRRIPRRFIAYYGGNLPDWYPEYEIGDIMENTGSVSGLTIGRHYLVYRTPKAGEGEYGLIELYERKPLFPFASTRQAEFSIKKETLENPSFFSNRGLVDLTTRIYRYDTTLLTGPYILKILPELEPYFVHRN